MAVTLNIPLGDNAQAAISDWIDTLHPGLTPADKKTFLEAHARRLLKEDLLRRIRERRAADTRETELAARRTEAAAVPVVDVFAPDEGDR